MKLIKCPMCGESDLIVVGNLYSCNICNSKFQEDEYQKYESLINKAINDGNTIELGNIRHIIDTILEKDHLDKNELKKWCYEIRKVLPDDNIAEFLIAYCDKKNLKSTYEAMIKNFTNKELEKYELNKIVPLMVKACDYTTKNIITDFLKSKNLLNEYSNVITEALKERDLEADRYVSEKDVFICHASYNKDKVFDIVNELEDNTISCWMAERNMPYDVDFYWENIENAIKDCKIFLFVLSAASRTSEDCKKELELAKKHNKAIRIEYRIENVENNIPLKKFFDGIQWIDNDIDQLCERVYESLEQVNKETIEQPVKEETVKVVKEIKEETIDYKELTGMLMFDEFDEVKERVVPLIKKNPYDEKLWKLLLDAELKGEIKVNPDALKTYKKLLKITSDKAAIKKEYSFLEEKEETSKATEKAEKVELKQVEKVEIPKEINEEANSLTTNAMVFA